MGCLPFWGENSCGGYGSRTGGHTGGECACCGGGEDCACCEASEKGLLLNVTERSTKEPLTGSCVNPTFDAWFFSDTTGTFFLQLWCGVWPPHILDVDVSS